MVKYVETKDCEPLVELQRDFYDQLNYQYLKKTIEKDGFKKVYSVRAIFNRRKDRYEIFDGIHRLQVARELGIPKIPLVDETRSLTRKQAIAEGIKANKTHAYYNHMDLAKNLQSLTESQGAHIKKKSLGRPTSVNLSDLSKLTGVSEKSISQHLQLLRLPEDVQVLIGTGKLYFSHALVLLRLDNTQYSTKIPDLAYMVVSEGTSKRDLERKINIILGNKSFGDNKVCFVCERVFSMDRLNRLWVCPQCMENIKERGKDGVRAARTKAMRKYLRFKTKFEEHWTKKGKKIPQHAEKILQDLKKDWEKERGWKYHNKKPTSVRSEESSSQLPRKRGEALG